MSTIPTVMEEGFPVFLNLNTIMNQYKSEHTDEEQN